MKEIFLMSGFEIIKEDLKTWKELPMKKNKLNLDFINYDESDLLVKEAMVVLKKIDFVYPLMNTKAIKVVFCANSSWYLYNFRKTTIEAFIFAGFDVHCIAPKDNYSQKIESIGASFSSF